MAKITADSAEFGGNWRNLAEFGGIWRKSVAESGGKCGVRCGGGPINSRLYV